MLGLWNVVLLFRRPLLALLSSVFEDVEAMAEAGRGRLRRSSLDELMLLVLTAPLAYVDMRAPVCCKVFAHDAEGEGGQAIVEAELPPAAVVELWRFTDCRGSYAMLERPGEGAVEVLGLPPLLESRSPPWSQPSGRGKPPRRVLWRNPGERALARLQRGFAWKRVLAWKSKRAAHINVLEHGAWRRLVRRFARRLRLHGHRVVSFWDSRVGLGVAAKGRSASRVMNRVQKRTVPDLLGAGI